MKMKIRYENKYGRVVLMHHNGNISELRNYKDNQLHNRWIKLHRDGKLISVARCEIVLKHGNWLINNDKGKTLYVLHYENGRKSEA